MGIGTSNANNTFNFDFFFNSDERNYFMIYPEEEVVNQPFEITNTDIYSHQKKENYILSAKVINEIFLNSSIITQEESQFNILKNIIIPFFSQCLFTNNPNLIDSKIIYQFYESLNNLFLERHNQYLSNLVFRKTQQITFSKDTDSQLAVETIDSFYQQFNTQFNQKKKEYFLNFSFQSSHINSDNIIQLINQNASEKQLIADSFLWSIFNSDLKLLIVSCQKLIELSDQIRDSKKKEKKSIEMPNISEAIFSQDFTLTDIIVKPENLNGYINYTASPFDIDSKQRFKGCILSASPHYLFAFNYNHRLFGSKSFLKISLSNHNISNLQHHYETIQANAESIVRSIDYCVTSVDNVIFICSSGLKTMCFDLNSKTSDRMIEVLQKDSTKIIPPITSDGHYIYSILNSKEIGVFSLNSNHDELRYRRSISIKYDKNNLKSPYTDVVIPNEFIENAAFVTNGIILEIIYPISIEINKITHFARVISLITGNHVHDFTFDLPYPIHSIALEPLTRSLWVLSCYNGGVCFNHFNYKGPNPLWLSELEIMTNYPKPKNCTTVTLFKDLAINYSHSIFSQFYGCEYDDDEHMKNFLSKQIDSTVFELIFSILDEGSSNPKFVQLLFIILSFKLKYFKMNIEQHEQLYKIMRKYISDQNYSIILTLFIIHIAPNIKSKFISKYFGIIFNSLKFDKSEHLILLLNLLSQLKDMKKFPFVLDNNCPVLTDQLFSRLCNEKITEQENNFIMSYLSSVFTHYSRTIRKNPLKIQLIENAAFSFTQKFIENAISLLSDLNSMTSFRNSTFILVFKKLLVFLKLTISSPTFVWPLLPTLLELLKRFPEKPFFKVDPKNSFYLCFMDVFFLYVYSFKQMLSFADTAFLKKHLQFLNIKIENEKNISDVFNNQINDDDFHQIITTIYSKVANPLNRRLTPEEAELDKYLFLSLFYKTQTIDEIIDLKNKIKNNEQITISQSIRQIAKAVYGIRSNLRLKRQNEDQNEYLKLHKSVTEKTHFLLKFSSEKSELKSISDFINSNIQTAEIILAQSKLQSVINSFSFFISYADSFITQELPINAIYLFIMHISSNPDIIEAYELVKNQTKIDLNYSKLIIQHLLEKVGQIPPNPILSFLCNLIIILSKSYDESQVHDFIYDSISNIVWKFCQESRNIESVVFKSCVSLLCHFHRILNEEKYFIIKENEVKIISNMFNSLDLKYSMSFTIEHSLHQGLFNKSKLINLMKTLVGYVGQPKFHSMSLLIYDHLQIFSQKNQENEFLSYIASVLDIIGTILSGANSNDLLQIATPIIELDKSNQASAYCRTPTSQLACVLELIQIIRRLILDKEPNSARLISRHFKTIADNFQINNKKYMKQLFAVLAILSNIIEIKRPFTIITNNENKSYFVTSFNVQNNNIENVQGLLLPITNKQIIKHSFENTNDLKSFELIPYKLSMLSDLEIPNSIFELATNIKMEKYSDCLYTFYALQCVKENILDAEKGAEYANEFLSKMENTKLNHFMFRENAQLILSLLKKSLTVPTDGIFVGSPVRPQFYHASFTQLEFRNDYNLTENLIEAFTSPHVFISSIIDDVNPVYFQVQFDGSNQQFDFGVITHSVDQNQSISITYSTQELGFCVNGEKVEDFQIEGSTLIECRYHPSKNKVSFADSKHSSRVFSCKLSTKSQCSFIALIHPGTKLNYACTFKPSTDCFQKNIHFRQIAHPTKLFSKVKYKLFTKQNRIKEDETKFSMMIQHEENEEKNDIVTYTKAVKKINNDAIVYTVQNSDFDTSSLYSFAQLDNIRETALLLAVYPDSSFSSILNVFSSPIQLKNYVQVQDVSGKFDLIQEEKAGIVNENSIPPFHFQKYHHLPVEVINCYFSGVCEFHRQEILTFLAARVIANSDNVNSSLTQFSISMKMLVNLVTSILLVLEPFKISNLNEGKSPIDFDTFNGFETCAKTNLYDYYSCLTKIVNHLQENGKEEFIKEWFNQLESDFHNKYMHFATQRNTNLITVRSLIIDSYQNFNLDDVSGWIIFPIKFGCYQMPSIKVNHLIFPKSFSSNVNYSCSEGKTLRIMSNNTKSDNDGLIAFGILPLFSNSNQSLFYSFYHLAVSFKYFVLFSQRDLSDKNKIRIKQLVFDSIVAGSPFFYTHSDIILPFLNSKLCVPFTPEYVKILNMFILSVSHLRHNGITQFINQQMSQAEDMKSLKFKYFISDSEPVPSQLEIPHPSIPQILDYLNTNSRLLFITISRVLLPNSSTNSSQFPFHLILSEWLEAFQMYPPCSLETVESNVVSITFLSYIPKSFQLFDIDFSGKEEVHVSYTGNFNESYKTFTVDNIKTNIKSSSNYSLVTPTSTDNKVYVKFTQFENVPQHFVVYSTCLNKSKFLPQLAYDCRVQFRTDLSKWCENYTENDDQQILKNYNPIEFSHSTFSTRPNVSFVGTLNNHNHQTHMNYLRSIYLVSFNYLVRNDTSLMTDDSLKRFYSLHFLSEQFMSLVNSHNGLSTKTMRIDRQKGLDVRNGISNDVSKSMIGQMTSYYMSNPRDFRHNEHPFHINYVNERGVDAGGLMRDFASELIKDINEPRIGLFVQTPNGKNHEGKYQDCIIPSPSPVISRSNSLYQTIGAFIAIGIRSGMKQPDLLFPPLFWNFIITGNLRIEDIYDIDKSYKTTTSNMLKAANEMTEEEFVNSMSSVSILNIRGDQITLDRRSASTLRNLSRSNCERFIAMCNQSRLNELSIPLQKIRIGFWENLNFDPPPFATPSLIEYLACGERIISVNDFRRVTHFVAISLTQRRYFEEMIHRMTNDERKKLLHFATGLNSITNRGLIVDPYGSRIDGSLPTASTCFFTLHLPSFSSAERMYRAFLIAINETGTFENC